ncbi:hypothetical protein IP70_15755 [alpha proteobacterium AAP38]|nr:hypothetical protein IP70_15755 [alpha proteobacterium AAP38]
MTGLEQLRDVMVAHGQSPDVMPLLNAAIDLARTRGEEAVLRALVDMAAQASCLSSPDARCEVMEGMADGGVMIAQADQAIRAGRAVRLTPVPDWAAAAAGRA